MRLPVSGTLAICAGLWLTACREATAPRSVLSLAASDSVVVPEGDSVRLTAAALDAGGDTVPGVAVAWVSEDSTVVRVSPLGWVYYGRPGHTRVIAMAGGRTRAVGVTTRVRYLAVQPSYDLGWCGLTDRGSLVCRHYPSWWDMALDSVDVYPVPAGVHLRDISVGAGHVCALTTEDVAYCWGDNHRGQLGADTGVGTYFFFVRDAVPVGGGHRFRSISAGAGHTCALTDAGEAWCWGERRYGRLGDGGSTLYGAQPLPVPVAGGLRFTTISAGTTQTCALAADSTAYCWGSNGAGQLGVGQYPPAESNVPLRVAGSARWVAVTAGGDHSCALDDAGRASCWGMNTSNELGRPDAPLCDSVAYGQPCDLAPAPVAGGLTFRTLLAGIHSEGTGNSDPRTCGLDANGMATCWGRRARGDTVVKGELWPVPGGLVFRSLAVATAQVCGLTVGGVACCFGSYWGDTPVLVPHQP